MKTVLITGASSGIGRATALFFAQNGWSVTACARSHDTLKSLVSEHANISALPFDVTSSEQTAQALEGKTFDCRILNAGVCEYIDIDDFCVETIRSVFETNFFGVVNCVQSSLSDLRRGDQLIIVDSLARLLPFTRSQAYGASKAAIHYFAKSLEVDLAGSGVKVKTVSPGFVKTPLTDRNTFDMPMRVGPEFAAKALLKSATSNRSSHYFPWVFSSLIKTLSALPSAVQMRICQALKTDNKRMESL